MYGLNLPYQPCGVIPLFRVHCVVRSEACPSDSNAVL